jgi:hypothetical protein
MPYVMSAEELRKLNQYEMTFDHLHKPNQFALRLRCEILVLLRGMPEKHRNNRVFGKTIDDIVRFATDSVTPFASSKKVSAQFISTEAQNQLETPDPSVSLVDEHVIPISVLVKEIAAKWNSWTDQNDESKREDLVSIFLKYSIRAIVTSTENGTLKKRGLHKCMPPGCSINDKFSRYERAGIEPNLRDKAHYNKWRKDLAGGSKILED